MRENLNERLADLIEPRVSLPVAGEDDSPGGWWTTAYSGGYHAGWMWVAPDFLESAAWCFKAVDEMARRGWCYSLEDPVEKNEPETKVRVFIWPFGHKQIGFVKKALAPNRREALVRGMIAALEAENGSR